MTTTVFVWQPHDDQVGHASVHVAGAAGRCYVSWWPQDEPKETVGGKVKSILWGVPGERFTFEKDMAGEGGRAPLRVDLTRLDEAKIIDWWRRANFTSWSLLNVNCAQIAVEALRQGGADAFIKGFSAWRSSWQASYWKPMEVYDFAVNVRSGGG
jgi:hypothetical protein